MNDMIDKRGALDGTRIFVNEDWQLKYWSTRFAVSEEDLRVAVQLVGDQAINVQRHFGVQNKSRWKMLYRPEQTHPREEEKHQT